MSSSFALFFLFVSITSFASDFKFIIPKNTIPKHTREVYTCYDVDYTYCKTYYYETKNKDCYISAHSTSDGKVGNVIQDGGMVSKDIIFTANKNNLTISDSSYDYKTTVCLKNFEHMPAVCEIEKKIYDWNKRFYVQFPVSELNITLVCESQKTEEYQFPYTEEEAFAILATLQ